MSELLNRFGPLEDQYLLKLILLIAILVSEWATESSFVSTHPDILVAIILLIVIYTIILIRSYFEKSVKKRIAPATVDLLDTALWTLAGLVWLLFSIPYLVQDFSLYLLLLFSAFDLGRGALCYYDYKIHKIRQQRRLFQTQSSD